MPAETTETYSKEQAVKVLTTWVDTLWARVSRLQRAFQDTDPADLDRLEAIRQQLNDAVKPFAFTGFPADVDKQLWIASGADALMVDVLTAIGIAKDREDARRKETCEPKESHER